MSSLSNIPELSVSELAFSLKKTLEDTYGRIRVRGELSQVKIHTSGHMYSSLKDDQAVISLVCWRGTVGQLHVRPEEGLDVIITGKVTTYPARSNYQIVVEQMELAGEGALLKMLEARKKALAAEGLFDAARKQTLPFIPQTIGVVTSPTGAVIRDILHRLNDRFPRHVQIWPVHVQGEGAAEEVAAAINGFNAMDSKPDVLIVARGGGSLEDLMPFNEEAVVRAVAASTIPVISAVGHETDTTLCDLAADVRAPTPTGAAEMAVPVRLNILAQVEEDGVRLFGAMRRTLLDLRNVLDAAASKLRDPSSMMELKAQMLDTASEKLQTSLTHALYVMQNRVDSISGKLRHPSSALDLAEQKYHGMARLLDSLSFKSVLARGYAVVRDEGGAIINNPDSTATDQSLDIEFKDNKHIKAVRVQ